MKQLFIPCPSCAGDNLFYTRYDAPLKILKERSWHVCKDCGYQMQMDQWKKSLCCA